MSATPRHARPGPNLHPIPTSPRPAPHPTLLRLTPPRRSTPRPAPQVPEHALCSEIQQLRDAPATRRVALTSLAPEAVGPFAAHVLGVDSIPEWLAADLYERSGGHPFGLHETLRELVQRGAVRVVAGCCAASPEELGMALFALDGLVRAPHVAAALHHLRRAIELGLKRRASRVRAPVATPPSTTSPGPAPPPPRPPSPSLILLPLAQEVEGLLIASHYFGAGAPELALPYLDLAALDALAAGSGPAGGGGGAAAAGRRRRPWSGRFTPGLAEQRRGAVLVGLLPVYSQLLMLAGDALHAAKYRAPPPPSPPRPAPPPPRPAAAGGPGAALAPSGVTTELAIAELLEGRARSAERVAAAALPASGGQAVPGTRALLDSLKALGSSRLLEVAVLRAYALHVAGDYGAAGKAYAAAVSDARRFGNGIGLMHALIGAASNRLWAGDFLNSTATPKPPKPVYPLAGALSPEVEYLLLEASGEAGPGAGGRFVARTLAVSAGLSRLFLARGERAEAEAEALRAAAALRAHRELPVSGGALPWALPLQLQALCLLGAALLELLEAPRGRAASPLEGALGDVVAALRRSAAPFALFRAPAAFFGRAAGKARALLAQAKQLAGTAGPRGISALASSSLDALAEGGVSPRRRRSDSPRAGDTRVHPAAQ
eukprot:tig00020816_g14147.t1